MTKPVQPLSSEAQAVFAKDIELVAQSLTDDRAFLLRAFAREYLLGAYASDRLAALRGITVALGIQAPPSAKENKKNNSQEVQGAIDRLRRTA